MEKQAVAFSYAGCKVRQGRPDWIESKFNEALARVDARLRLRTINDDREAKGKQRRA